MLRVVKVYFNGGDTITTSMAAHLTDDDIKKYYKVGSWFNIGSVQDRMVRVECVEILA